ncbi:unnamed protein product [marine sediment metagenome]|uniref:Ribbon-helix-helix protein CopG domain-containing protein n=1 Tax=marine sediment metagenome TaxID=412755 RepID=X1JWU2_9ZZZZ
MVEKTRNSITLPRTYQDALDKLASNGVFLDRQDVMRDALRDLFEKYKMAPFYPAPDDEESE